MQWTNRRSVLPENNLNKCNACGHGNIYTYTCKLKSNHYHEHHHHHNHSSHYSSPIGSHKASANLASFAMGKQMLRMPFHWALHPNVARLHVAFAHFIMNTYWHNIYSTLILHGRCGWPHTRLLSTACNMIPCLSNQLAKQHETTPFHIDAFQGHIFAGPRKDHRKVVESLQNWRTDWKPQFSMQTIAIPNPCPTRTNLAWKFPVKWGKACCWLQKIRLASVITTMWRDSVFFQVTAQMLHTTTATQRRPEIDRARWMEVF